MTDADGTCSAATLDIKVNSEPEEGEEEEEEESVACHVELGSDDIPASLLSYFESSKSRAATCEKLILEDLEDFAAPHLSEWPLEAKLDLRKQTEQVFCDTVKQEDQTDTSLSLKPTDKQEASSSRILSPCSSIEDEGSFDENVADEVKICDSEAERQKQQQEEMKNTEQRRRREQEFQEELRRILETEKLHQIELEEQRKKAEEKLEQELQLQQELIGDLRKRVELERRTIEEEQRRNKEEQRKRKEREEEERRRKEKEEERKRVEMRQKEEDRRKREEVKRKEEEEKKRQMVMLRLKEEEESRKEEEERRKVVEMKLKEEEDMIKEKSKEKEEKRRNIEKRLREEEDMRQKREEERRWQQEEETRKWNEMNLRKEEERRKKEAEEKRKWLEMEKKKEEEAVKKEEERRIKETQLMEGKRQVQSEENRMESQELKGEKEEDGSMVQVPESKIMEMKGNRELDLNEELRKLKKEEEREEKEASKKEREIEEKAGVKEDGRREEGARSLIELEMKTEKESERQDELRKTKEGERKTSVEQEEKVKEKEEVKKEKEVMTTLMKNKEEGLQLVRGEEKTVTDEERSQSVAKEETLTKEEEKEMNEKEKVMIKERDKKNECKQDSRVNHERKTEEKQEEVGLLHNEQDTKSTRRTGNIETEERGMEEGRGSSPPSSDSCQPAPSAGDAAHRTPEPPSEYLLLQRTEEKRLCWMKECVSWSTLAHHNRRKQRGSARGQRGGKRTPRTTLLPPLCPHTLLQATGWKALQEVTVLSLEELPACSLSTLVHCSQLQSLTLRRCGLRALEGISSLHKLCYIDLQENDISYVDCENMTQLRVLRLARNKLTSIHGLSGLDSLGVLDLSHNSITRIAGLESMRSLQKLLVAHNQLVSTKGLRDVCALLHLDCSHNHLVRVEGLEKNALLHTLDLSANSLAEPPSLSNHVLLQELHLDENSISSLRGLAAYWLPLMWRLSVGHNSITELPPMSDFVSLEYLDLKFNCLSELRNMCENLEGCQALREVHLSGNPLQQESGWRSTLQKVVPGLRCVDGQLTEPRLPPPSALPAASTLCSFRTFCQAQLQQTRDLQRRHSRELSSASLPLDTVETLCLHLTETLKLAEVHRFAHEYGDTTVTELQAGEQTTPKEVPDNVAAEKLHTQPKVGESTKKVRPVVGSRDDSEGNHLTSEVDPVAESQHGSSDTVTEGQGLSFPGKTRTKASSDIEDSPADLKNAAALVIQQRWKTYRERCRNVTAPPVVHKGGAGEEAVGGRPESGTSGFMRGALSKGDAAAVIQAFWRGYALRKRLASALAAVTWPDAAEDDTFEEVDVDEFAFDEASLDKQWTLTLSADLPLRLQSPSEQPLSAKPPETRLGPSQSTFQVGNPKQAWVALGEAQKTSPGTSERSKSPALPSVLSGLSKRSEEILDEWGFTDSHTALLMLKRAQKMRATDRPQRKQRDPSARQAAFRSNHHQPGRVEALSRPAPRIRSFVKVGEATLGLQHAETSQRGSRGRAQQHVHTQADGPLESEHFLPEINSSILKGGRVQLVADPAYADHLHHVTGLWANGGSSSSSSLAAWPCKVSSPPHRNSSGHARQDIPSQERETSAPAKRERIPARDSGRRQTWDRMNKWS